MVNFNETSLIVTAIVASETNKTCRGYSEIKWTLLKRIIKVKVRINIFSCLRDCDNLSTRINLNIGLSTSTIHKHHYSQHYTGANNI